jgi:hypothetical protein
MGNAMKKCVEPPGAQVVIVWTMALQVTYLGLPSNGPGFLSIAAKKWERRAMDVNPG